MAYIVETPQILISLGYRPDDGNPGFDFSTTAIPGGVQLNWFNADPEDPYYPDGPTEQDILDLAKPWAASVKLNEIVAWVAQLNGRAFEHAANSDDFDELKTADILAVRNCVNKLAEKVGTPQRVTVAEAVQAFTDAAAEFDLIREGKRAGNLMIAEVEAMVATSTMEQILAYEVSDSHAASLHATEYPTESPTLAALLAQFPV
jgi:hypothetical protein